MNLVDPRAFINADSANVFTNGIDPTWLEVVNTMRVILESAASTTSKGKDVPIRNVLEGKIHQSFTVAADVLFSRGYLTRDQRIALSSTIGKVLESFGNDTDKAGLSSIVIDASDAVSISEKSTFKVLHTTKEALPRWLVISSSNRRDRDGQLVSEKALRKAVAIADATGYRGPLRWWHTKEKGKVLDLGMCDFQVVYKGFLIESGTFVSQAVADAVEKASDTLKLSIGFLHPKTEPVAGIFDNIAIYERSLLPKGVESNLFTALSII